MKQEKGYTGTFYSWCKDDLKPTVAKKVFLNLIFKERIIVMEQSHSWEADSC
jgi:hypothetical protein